MFKIGYEIFSNCVRLSSASVLKIKSDRSIRSFLKLTEHSDPEHGINVKTQSLSNAKTVKLILKRTL